MLVLHVSGRNTRGRVANVQRGRGERGKARYSFRLDPQATTADIAAIVDHYPVYVSTTTTSGSFLDKLIMVDSSCREKYL